MMPVQGTGSTSVALVEIGQSTYIFLESGDIPVAENTCSRYCTVDIPM